MDISTLITPILQTITQALPYIATNASSSSSRGIIGGIPSTATTSSPNSLTIDRALGTVASIGLTMAVYRLLTALIRHRRARNGNDVVDGVEDGGEVAVSLYTMTQVLLQGLWAGSAAIPRTVMRTVGLDSKMTGGADSAGKKMRTYAGSCHCNSIRFRLRAPSHLSAKDCQGKIRYPHIYTTASNFQLTSGTESLSVYYVRLPSHKTTNPKPPSNNINASSSSSSTSSSSDDDESTEKGNIAAHTFCNRCGVHILRAPDPKSNELEVNTDCLDVFYDRRGYSSAGAVTIDVTTDDVGNGRGLSGGRPMMIDRLTTVIDDDAENDDDIGEVDDGDGGGGGGERREENPMGGLGGKRVSARWGDWPNRQLSSLVDDDDDDNDDDNDDEASSTTPHHNERRRRARRPPRPPNTTATVPRLVMSDTNSTDGISPPSTASSELSSSDRKLDDDQTVGISSPNGTTTSVTVTKTTTTTPTTTTTTTTPSSRTNSFSLGQGTFQVDGGTTTTPQQSQQSPSMALSQLEYYMRKHVTPPVSDAEE